MDTLKSLWVRYGSSPQVRVLVTLAALIVLGMANGAPGAGSGSGSIGGF